MTTSTQSAHPVRIQIDENRVNSPNPTTGQALYELASLGSDISIFQEVDGPSEDLLVARDGTPIQLHQDAHFHSSPATRRSFRIVVNAEPKTVHKRVLSYADVVALAYPNPPSGPNVIITVLYKHAASRPHEGTLSAGESVKVKDGTVFNVRVSDKS